MGPRGRGRRGAGGRTLTALAVVVPDTLRLTLLAGLAAHKALWEILKRRQGIARDAAPRSISTRAVKLGKLGVLAFLAVQTICLEILPLTAAPGGLRLVGAAIFAAGLVTAMSARVQLGRHWSDLEDAGVRPGQSVVDRGIYRYIRHPIYVGDLLLLVGLQLSLNSWLVLLVLPLAAIVVRRALREETLLAESLSGYRAYCTRTKRFIPFLA